MRINRSSLLCGLCLFLCFEGDTAVVFQEFVTGYDDDLTCRCAQAFVVERPTVFLVAVVFCSTLHSGGLTFFSPMLLSCFFFSRDDVP